MRCASTISIRRGRRPCAASIASPPGTIRPARCARDRRPHLHRRADPARGRRCRDHAGGLRARRRSRDHPPRHQARRQHPPGRRGRCARLGRADGGAAAGPADLGLLAALGFVEVPVRRKLTVALLSTGDEVREPGELLRRGQIHDANRYILAGLLERLGVDVSDRGIVRDDPARLNDALQRAAAESDLIITSGGVSTGEEDHVRTAIANHGSLYFWRLAIKPGRPVAMGQIGATPLAGLPGNPVAALLTFVLVARPMIEALGGATPHVARRFRVVSDFAYKKKAGRREYVRASLEGNKARRFHKEGAGMLTSLTETDGLVELPEEVTRLGARHRGRFPALQRARLARVAR